MNRQIPPVLLEHYLIKTIMSLSSAAARTESDDVRDDLRDSAAILIRLAMAGADDDGLRAWCSRSMVMLDAMSVREDRLISEARLSVMRLISVLPESVKSKPVTVQTSKKQPRSADSVLGVNQKKISEFVSANPDVRTRELIMHFQAELSDRTIKRCLKELVTSGILQRVQKDGAVLYRRTA